MSVDWTAVAEIGLFAVACIGLLSAIGARLFRGENAAEIAKAAAADAAKAREDLAAYREYVAEHYASKATLDQMEQRVVDAINRLGDRLDLVFQPRSAPRSRATKV